MAKKLSEKKTQQSSKGKGAKTTSKTKDKKKSKKVNKPDWFNQKPSDLHKEVTWNNQEWNWCGKDTDGHCESFVIHKPTECKGLKQSVAATKSTNNKRVKIQAQETMIENHKESHETSYDDTFLS